MSHECDVIVVGAGAAGLLAARELAAAGLDVLVLEAAARAGGRILTTRHAATDAPLELGAEFIHGEAPVTYELLQQAGLRYTNDEGRNLRAGDGALAADERQFDRIARLLGRIDTNAPDESFAAWLSRQRRVTEDTRRMALRFVEGFHAADAARISAISVAGEEQAEAVERSGRVLAGQGALVEFLAAPLATALRPDVRVRRIEWRRGRCTVHVLARDEPQRYHARAVVVTVSIAVLQQGDVVLDPLPRETAQALGLLALGHVLRIPFLFRDRFWEDARVGGGVARNAGFIHTPASPFNVWWTQYPVRVPLLTAWAGGRNAQALLRESPARRAEIALADLARALGLRPPDVVRRVEHWQAHDWSADPLVAGAYSYPLVGGAEAGKVLGRVHQGTLAIAGEATSPENGTVEGALASGRRAARALLRTLR